MSLKSFLGKIFASYISKREKAKTNLAVDIQNKTFLYLISEAKNTQFGKEHHFDKIHSYEDFKKYVPFGDYELLKSYIEIGFMKILEGLINL